jgi:transposase
MREFTPQHKHNILTHYCAGVRGSGFAALARRFAVKGGAGVILRWHVRWDGTPASLQEQPRSGRPRTLSRAEISRHVRAPLLAANRAHRAVHYTTLLPAVRAKTGKELSLRTLRRYGKEQLGAKQKRSKKRTAGESESAEAHEGERACLPVEQAS